MRSVKANNPGDTLLSVLIAGAIGGLMTMATFTSIDASIDSRVSGNGIGDKAVLKSQMQNVITSETVCREFFKHKNTEISGKGLSRCPPPQIFPPI